MKMSKRSSIILGVIAIIVIYVGLFVGIKVVIKHNSQKIYNQITEVFDNVDRDMAIKQLSELRGMILELESLKHEDISQNILLNELEEITAQKHFTNPYLKDFVFIIPSTSNVGELCEELISQIDNQIHTIEFDAKGE